MNARKFERGIMLLSFSILLVFMTCILVRFATKQILVNRLHMNNSIVRSVFFDNSNLWTKKPEDKDKDKSPWDEQYAFTSEPMVSRGIFIEEWNTKLKVKVEDKLAKKIADWSNKYGIPEYYRMVELGRKYELFLGGWNIADYERNSAIRLQDGYLEFLKKKLDMTPQIEKVVTLSELCNQQGIKLLYVVAPSKMNKYGSQGINDVLDFRNEDIDCFLEGLKANNIDYIDMREDFRGDDEYLHYYFFKTDHHWNAEGAIKGASVLAKYLNEKYQFNLDLTHFKRENFYMEHYDNYFLGSQGKKLTLTKSSPEDFDLYFTKETPVLHYVNFTYQKGERTGDFSVVYDMKNLERPDYYNLSCYGAYDRGSWQIENKDAASDKKILFIGDSFGEAAAPIFSLATKEVTYFRGGEKFSIANYIEGEHPDIVILFCYPDSITDKLDFKRLHVSHFDFR